MIQFGTRKEVRPQVIDGVDWKNLNDVCSYAKHLTATSGAPMIVYRRDDANFNFLNYNIGFAENEEETKDRARNRGEVVTPVFWT